MGQTFLEQLSLEANRKTRRLALTSFIFFAVLGAILCFALGSSIDTTDPRDKKLVVMFGGLVALMLIFTAIALIKSCIVCKNGENLKLPFDGQTKEEAARTINNEATNSEFLFDQNAFDFSKGKQPSGDRVIVTPTYLLLCMDRSKVIAIPREKVLWLCAQAGIKGRSSYVVRLLIFTEKSTFTIDDVDVGYVEALAEQLYSFFPNIFDDRDPFPFSYEFEALFNKDRAGFMELYQRQKLIYEAAKADTTE